ncbi:MAG: hypothetical protein K8H88_30830 [Sandaracinaceae bacterium]|nr:hypothetical protein [Sandaracinaceae bacterium]
MHRLPFSIAGVSGIVPLARGPGGDEGYWLFVRRKRAMLLLRADSPDGAYAIVREWTAVELRESSWESRLVAGAESIPLGAIEAQRIAWLLRERVSPPPPPHACERAAALPALPRPTRSLSELGWSTLVAPELDPIVRGVAMQLWPSVLSLLVRPDESLGLLPKHLVDPLTSTITFVRSFGFAAKALGNVQPRLFVRTDIQGGLTHVPAWPLASFCGATLLSGFEPLELLFVCGQHLAMARPELYLATLIVHPNELAVLLGASLRLAARVSPDDRYDALARKIATKIRPPQVHAIRELWARVDLAPAGDDLHRALEHVAQRWLFGVALTAARAGLLVTDDLAAAVRMLERLPPLSGARVTGAHLARFWLSDEHRTLRDAIGLRPRG